MSRNVARNTRAGTNYPGRPVVYAIFLPVIAGFVTRDRVFIAILPTYKTSTTSFLSSISCTSFLKQIHSDRRHLDLHIPATEYPSPKAEEPSQCHVLLQ